MFKNIGVFKDFKDDSLKSVFADEQNKIIEMTLLANKENIDVVCVPTHHFCNLGCQMCHLTNSMLHKPMLPIKESDFLACLMQTLTKKENDQRVKRTNKKNLLLSFMGVGEPLLNLQLIKEVFLQENYIKEKLNYDHIGYALATMMPQDISSLQNMVLKYKMPLKLHFSLHNPLDDKRHKLLPSSKISVAQAMESLQKYQTLLKQDKKIMSEFSYCHRTQDVVEIHYTLIKDVNDGQKELTTLVNLLKKYPLTIKFIRFNPKEKLQISREEGRWLETLATNLPNVRVKTYAPPGKEIGSSCGEFTKHYYHMEIETLEEYQEFKNWQKLHQVENNN